MKSKIHAIGGTLGFVLLLVLVATTLVALSSGDPQTLAASKAFVFKGTIPLPLVLMGVGATGMSLLGKRTESLALIKQKRGPRAFMTSLFVLVPSSYFLASWADAEAVGALFYGVQGLELAGSFFALIMIGLNIRDGLALRGRIGAADEKEASIKERQGGPLVAVRLPVLESFTGKVLKNGPVLALCRCGASKNKPYCDGSHNDIGFDSSLSEDRTADQVLTYEGKELTIHYNRLLCSHAAECGKRQKAAFDSSRKPWIVPDNASKEEILEVVRACPSGALRVALPGEEPRQMDAEKEGIVVEENGPYRVSGVALGSPRLATGANPNKYVLCRCGASKNKPYCDGSHYDIDWKGSAGE